MLASDSEQTFNTQYFHSIIEHTRQPEGNLFWVLFPQNGCLETITKVNMDHHSCEPIQHQITWVTVTQTENVPYHQHDCQQSSVGSSAIKPQLRQLQFQPQHFIQVLASGIVQCTSENFNLLQQSERVIIRRHLQHNTMFDIQENLTQLSVLTDKYMEGVQIRYPTQETHLRQKRGCRVSLNIQMTFETFRIIDKKCVDKPE